MAELLDPNNAFDWKQNVVTTYYAANPQLGTAPFQNPGTGAGTDEVISAFDTIPQSYKEQALQFGGGTSSDFTNYMSGLVPIQTDNGSVWVTPQQAQERVAEGDQVTSGYSITGTTTSIGNPVEAPSGAIGASPSLPSPTGTNAAATYTSSLTQQLEQQTKALLDEANRRAQEYQTQITQLEQEQQALTDKQELGMTQMGDMVEQQAAEKRAQMELEKQRFDENYNANQALIGELGGLLTQGNQIIEQLKGTTGLASIMEPRIAQTMSDVAARAGVIQAVLSARNGQMSYAQQQLSTSLNAISSIYSDQIGYYTSLVNFYDSLKDENGDKIVSLTSTQKDYLDVKLNVLQNQLETTQATAKMISQAMLDPDTAMAYAKSGVTLNDNIQTINQKLGQYAYSQELADISNKMAASGYSTTPIKGVTGVPITDSTGKTKLWYKVPEATDGTFTLGANDVRFDSSGNVIASGPGVETTTSSPLAGKMFMQTGTGDQLTAEQIKSGSYSGSFIDMKTGEQYTADQIKSSFTTTTSKSTAAAGTTTTVAGLLSGKTFVSGQLEFTPDQYQAGMQELLAARGPDRYVDPAVYLQGLDNWIDAKGLQSDFLQLYPLKDYINPLAATNGYWPRIATLMGKTGTSRSI